jgi:hypothetical protein
MGPGYGSDNGGSQLSSFPGGRSFAKTRGNALTAVPQHSPQQGMDTRYESTTQNATSPHYGATQSGSPQHGVSQQAVSPQYGAQAAPTSNNVDKVVAGT